MNTKTIGRNDPCPCGSGKKYKQCCQGKENTNSEAAKNRLLENVPTLFKQAQIAIKANDVIKAEELYQKILSVSPKHTDTLNDLAYLYQLVGKKDQAINVLKKSVSIEPSSEKFYNLAQLSGCSNQGFDYIKKSIEMNPGNAFAYNLLGSFLLDTNQSIDAIAAFTKAISINPSQAATFNNLANAYLYLGDNSTASKYYKKAIKVDPFNDVFHKSLLFSLTYEDSSFFNDYLTAAAQLNKLWKSTAKQYTEWKVFDKTSPLKIGFVSGDLGYHPVGYFIEGLLANLNKNEIECYAYHTRHPSDEDEASKRLASYCHTWHNIHYLTDQQAAQCIYNDGIHILIDLSGYTVNTGLSLFSWRPAPIQISWLGYFASTGLDFIDYFIADPLSITEYNKQFFTEKLLYLPQTRLCYTPPTDIDAKILPAPTKLNKHITFGCFQHLSKINDQVLKTWSKILKQLPNSKFLFKNKKFNDVSIKEIFLKRLSQFDINTQQIILEGSSPRQEYFDSYNRVDFMLDTFPYTGGTTTCEALFMGVPTLTLTGKTLLQRQGQSMLTNVQLVDWISFSEQEYIDKAVDFAQQSELLESLRQKLRQQAINSPLMDVKQFSKDFTFLLLDVWQKHIIQ